MIRLTSLQGVVSVGACAAHPFTEIQTRTLLQGQRYFPQRIGIGIAIGIGIGIAIGIGIGIGIGIAIGIGVETMPLNRLLKTVIC